MDALFNRYSGQSMTEFPAGLSILFLCFVLPAITMFMLMLSYFLGWYLNYLETRYAAYALSSTSLVGTSGQAALPSLAEYQQVQTYINDQSTGIVGQWLNGLGSFTGVTSSDMSQYQVQYPGTLNCTLNTYQNNGIPPTTASVVTVNVTTTTVCRPLWLSVWTLGTTNSVTFTYSSSRMLENSSLDTQQQ